MLFGACIIASMGMLVHVCLLVPVYRTLCVCCCMSVHYYLHVGKCVSACMFVCAFGACMSVGAHVLVQACSS